MLFVISYRIRKLKKIDEDTLYVAFLQMKLIYFTNYDDNTIELLMFYIPFDLSFECTKTFDFKSIYRNTFKTKYYFYH